MPFVAIAACALRPWPWRGAERLATRLRLPWFLWSTPVGLVVSMLPLGVVRDIAGKRPSNECAELAAVLVVLLGTLWHHRRHGDADLQR